MGGDRPDPILILCKAAGYSWPTARDIILRAPRQPGKRRADGSKSACANFDQLSASTAQRVVRFWQVGAGAVLGDAI